MKIHRLDRHELTRWRQNLPHFVDPDGTVRELLPPGLDPLLAGVRQRAIQQRKDVTLKVQHLGVVYLVEVTVTVSRTNAVATTLTVDGRSIATGREVLYDELFEKYGPCQVRAPNGVILKVVRDPTEERPTVADGQRLAPRPSACPCKDWGAPHPGVHHQTCQFNRLAPAEERAPERPMSDEEIATVPASALSPAPPPQASPHAAPVVSVTPAARAEKPSGPVSPGECPEGCRSWPLPGSRALAADQHHPSCPHALSWAQHQNRSRSAWLIDLRSGERVRQATLGELADSDIAKTRTGQPVIFLDDVPYAVVPETELLAESA